MTCFSETVHIIHWLCRFGQTDFFDGSDGRLQKIHLVRNNNSVEPSLAFGSHDFANHAIQLVKPILGPKIQSEKRHGDI